MFKKLFNKLATKNNPKSNLNDESLVWYDVGINNPFNKKILDIRFFTNKLISTTTEKDVADLFWKLRESDGTELLLVDRSGFLSVICNLNYPHDGTVLDGILYKSELFENKWDIYVRNCIFYFADSWSGELVFMAYADIGEEKIEINEIEYNPNARFDTSDSDLVIDTVHFLILSHILQLIVPHPISSLIPEDETSLIAHLSFRYFGKFAFYATRERLVDLDLRCYYET